MTKDPKNLCQLDFDEDGRLCLCMFLEDGGQRLVSRGFFRVRLARARTTDSLDVPGIVRFRDDLPYEEWKKIDELFARNVPALGYGYETTERFHEQLTARDLHIRERSTLGLDLKRHDPRLEEQFEEFSEIVNRRMERRLRDRQMRDAFFLTMMRKSCNFSVPGSGKTSSVYGMFAFLQERQGMKRLVMIGPLNAFGSWEAEFRACFGNKQELHLLDAHEVSPSEEGRCRVHLRHFQRHDDNLMLFNYESIQKWQEELAPILADPGTLLVFDEVHRVKNPYGKRAQVALNLAAQAHHVTILTGTPAPNGYQDLYNLMHILFPEEWRDVFNYTMNDLKDPLPGLMQQINADIQPFYCRTTKEELHVPPASPDLLKSVHATPEENRLFYLLRQAYGKENMLAYFIRVMQLETVPQMLLQEIDASEFNSVLDKDAEKIEDIRFRDFSDEVPELVAHCGRLGSKLQLGVQQAEKLVKERKTVICWCYFKATIRSLQAALAQKGIRAEIIDGSTPTEERATILAAYHQKRFPVLITNPQTLAESVSLHDVCHDAIYIEYSYNLVHLLQSKDRIHRLGLPEGQYTQYRYCMETYDFRGQDVSFGRAVYDRLREKEETMLNAIDDGVLEKATSTDADLRLIIEEVFGRA